MNTDISFSSCEVDEEPSGSNACEAKGFYDANEGSRLSRLYTFRSQILEVLIKGENNVDDASYKNYSADLSRLYELVCPNLEYDIAIFANKKEEFLNYIEKCSQRRERQNFLSAWSCLEQKLTITPKLNASHQNGEYLKCILSST